MRTSVTRKSIDADVLSTLTSLWPGRRIGLNRGTGNDKVTFLAVPGPRRPRLLVPDDPRAARTSLGRYSAALNRRETAVRALSGKALRLGARLYPWRIHIGPGGEPSILDHLEEVVGSSVSLSLGIGSERINRKPVLGVFRDDGTAIAYAKIARDPYTSALVDAEAKALQTLQEIGLDGVETPRVLHVGAWNGARVLVISALQTQGWVSRRIAGDLARQVTRELHRHFRSEPLALRDTPLWRRLPETFSSEDGDGSAKWTQVRRGIERKFGDHEVEVSAWHGDLTPWNLARSGPTAQVWDWERFEVGVPAGMDTVHYLFATSSGGRSYAPAAASEIASHLGGASRPLLDVYLLTLAGRYLAGAAATGAQGPRHRADNILETARTLPT